MMATMRKLLIALLATTLLVACGGGDDDDDVAASDDGDTTETTVEGDDPVAPTGETDVECLPPATLSEITGFTMGEPDPSDVPTLYLQCLFTAEDDVHGVQTLEYYASDDIQSHVDIFIDVADDEVAVEIGDQAYWSASLSKIIVVHGDRAAEVSVSYFDPPEYDPKQLATDVALAILR